MAASSACTAQWSGVVPSGSAAVTSAPLSIAARTAAASTALMASSSPASTASAAAARAAPEAATAATSSHAAIGRNAGRGIEQRMECLP